MAMMGAFAQMIPMAWNHTVADNQQAYANEQSDERRAFIMKQGRAAELQSINKDNATNAKAHAVAASSGVDPSSGNALAVTLDNIRKMELNARDTMYQYRLAAGPKSPKPSGFEIADTAMNLTGRHPLAGLSFLTQMMGRKGIRLPSFGEFGGQAASSQNLTSGGQAIQDWWRRRQLSTGTNQAGLNTMTTNMDKFYGPGGM